MSYHTAERNSTSVLWSMNYLCSEASDHRTAGVDDETDFAVQLITSSLPSPQKDTDKRNLRTGKTRNVELLFVLVVKEKSRFFIMFYSNCAGWVNIPHYI
ncbi:hypothetical protein NPIL_478211 [Nephila pilipes]|uniref:Uncharacterized protein n=1 Tax=Nephila pilipes TaxID=299642 RepID=A0A8X6UDV6_NEPPI|nr:hypothetical protein NPIL_478211 [Nephila pilipes]